MWENDVQRGRTQMTIWLHAGYLRPQIHTLKYVILIAFPLQQWLQERASMLRHMCIACLVDLYQLVNDLDKERMRTHSRRILCVTAK